MRGMKGPAWKVEVAAPQEKAYAYVADILKHPEWAMDEMAIRADGGDGSVKVGSKFSAEGTLFNKRNPSTVTVTALNPSSSLEFEAQDSSGINGHVFTFEKTATGTRITRQLYGIKQPLLGPILFLLFKGSIDKNFNGALSNLKAKLES